MKVAVIGLGKLGSIHLRIYREIAEIKKIYAVDTDESKLIDYKDLETLSDYRHLKDKVDLVSIATPTINHFEIAGFFLANKIPVLVEKPITVDTAQAKKLIDLSKKNKTLLFVGHVERYNNAYIAAKKIIKNPLFIECHRLSLYPNRSLDISVILDLMIHDLDLVLDLAKDDIRKVEAKGVKVLSPSEDIANARITFKNGCVANITASRISVKRERKIRIFMNRAYISLDYAQQTVEIYQKVGNEIKKEVLAIDKEEPLKKEIAHFVSMVRKKMFRLDYAEKSKNALELAIKIRKIVDK
ncbi:MAG: Gfo/Idh/MocA family oxidoreductase [Candidatus Omnitrophica bacterium]|nr:Gfo/Idh/MocA family oxidoreductase [Candidatus Omnitrophota bacterium]